MRKSVLISGLIVIALMCLVPPMEVETVNAFSDSAVLQGLGASADAETVVQYVPVWSEPGGEGLRSAEDSSLATQRLMLQVLVVSVVAGGVALVTADE